MNINELMIALLPRYEKAVGRPPTMLRLRRAAKFCLDNDLEPNQVVFEEHYDRKWNQRRGREEHERDAVCLGNTNKRTPDDPTHIERWWIVRKKKRQRKRKGAA